MLFNSDTGPINVAFYRLPIMFDMILDICVSGRPLPVVFKMATVLYARIDETLYCQPIPPRCGVLNNKGCHRMRNYFKLLVCQNQLNRIQ